MQTAPEKNFFPQRCNPHGTKNDEYSLKFTVLSVVFHLRFKLHLKSQNSPYTGNMNNVLLHTFSLSGRRHFGIAKIHTESGVLRKPPYKA